MFNGKEQIKFALAIVWLQNDNFLQPILGIVIYLHIEGALYAQKSVPSWFLAVFDSKIDVCWNLKKVVNSLIH